MSDAASPRPPHARRSPPWTDCGPVGGPDFGRVFAWRVADGAMAFTFDRRGAWHALTLFDCPVPPAELVVHGRRFDVLFDPDRTPVIR